MIKYVLENNILTQKEPNDRYARVVEVRTRTQEDLAQAVADRNMGISKPEVLAMLEAQAEIIERWVSDGDAVLTRTVHIHPTVPGVYKEGEYPSQAVVRATPTKELSEAIKHTPLQHTEPISPIRIEFVHDIPSNTTNDKITRGGTAKIKGHSLKIAGTDPSVGIEFISIEDPEAIYKVAAKNILINNPSELMIIAPQMVVNEEVIVRVTTQYSPGTSLKKPRSYTFERKLKVVTIQNE
ncbi:MAG: DUF4469 domain-containing protein [Tannerella sp.]|jgi:hypothetical protein|nr:DUF4469 domain-containing protein [Tannerella sp.]